MLVIGDMPFQVSSTRRAMRAVWLSSATLAACLPLPVLAAPWSDGVATTTAAQSETASPAAQEPQPPSQSPAPQGPQPSPGSAPSDFQEVVVTAQRRTERLQDVPIAATAYSGDQLESKAIERVTDLQFAAPSLSITDAGETQSVNIRGIGIASNSPNISNGVATYLDGLFQPPIVTSIPFYDIATIEVLRGPQGTLVGNNSTGGAIFVNSKNPTVSRIEGYAQAAVGNYDSFEGEGALNLPLGDTLAVRVAGAYRNRDSFYRDVGPFKNRAGRLDEKGGRIGVLWNPGSFQALLKLQFHDQDTGGYANRPVEGTRFSAFRVGDIRTLSYDAAVRKVERAFLTSLELRYEFANGLNLRSLSGYQYKRNIYLADTDASQAPLAAGGGRVTDYFAGEKQYNQEINILSPTEGRFDWIVGGYYQHNDIVVNSYQIAPAPPVFVEPRNQKDILGVFAQGNYEFTREVELQLGARYSHFDASGTGGVTLGRGATGFPPAGILLSDLSGAHKDGRVTGKAALNWKPADNQLLYGFVARGYKPGGFNALAQFEPETVWNYEVGYKGELANRRIRVQLDAFYNDYNNLQFDVINPVTGVNGIQNVASSTIKGVEGQIQGRFGGFGFDGGFGYLDSKLSSLTFINARLLPPGTLGPQCPAGVPSNPPACFNYTPFVITNPGGPNLYSPKWSYNLGAEYRFRFGGEATLTPRLNFGYVGSRFNYFAYGPSDRLQERGLLSGLITLTIDKWTLQAFATNLTNKDYVVGRTGANEFYGAPREYGIRAGITF